MKKLQIATLVIAASLTIQARASIVAFDITFTGNDGVVDTGQITAMDNGSGSYTATGGFLTISSGGILDPLKYFLVTAGSPPTVAGIVGSGGLNLNGDNKITFPSNPYLDSQGLVFDTTDGSDGPVINLWGNGANNYTLVGTSDQFGIPYGKARGQFGQLSGDSTITLAPVPEVSTVIAGLLLLLPFGASAFRVLRKNPSA